MKKYLISLISAIALLFTSCSKEELPIDISDADRQGRADAVALCQAKYTTERDLHSALLAVKSREFEMRLSGDSLCADAYISAFKQQLSESDKNLANKIL